MTHQSPPADQGLVSVVIPTFNRLYLVGESIESVLGQDWPHCEILIVDDGSTDGTSDWLTRRYGHRIRIVRQMNLGPAAARNRGIRASNGEFLTTLDSDDLLTDGSIRSRVETLRDNPDADGCFGWHQNERDGALFGWACQVHPSATQYLRHDDLLAAYIDRPFFHHGEMMLRRRIVPADGRLYDSQMRCLEDFLMIVRLLCTSRIVCCPRVVTIIRDAAGHDRQRYDSDSLREQGMAPVERLLRDATVARRLGPLISHLRGHFLDALANASWRAGCRDEYRKFVRMGWLNSRRLRAGKSMLRFVGSFLPKVQHETRRQSADHHTCSARK